jgi:outer membrane lipoprotein LolB
LNWRLAPLLACALLAACATTPPEQPPARSEIRDFALDARFALRVSLPDRAPESSSGRLAWQHKNGDNRILISSPLGIGMAEIDTGPTLSRLRTADGQTRESPDPDALMEEVSGQRLPIRQLPDWLLGRSGKPATLEKDGSGRPLRLSEAGWQIDYAYADNAPDALPELVTLRRNGEIELRLRIEEWRLTP